MPSILVVLSAAPRPDLPRLDLPQACARGCCSLLLEECPRDRGGRNVEPVSAEGREAAASSELTAPVVQRAEMALFEHSLFCIQVQKAARKKG